MKKHNPNDLTLRNLRALRKDIEKLKEEGVKYYNKLWLMIHDLKKKVKELKKRRKS